MINCVVTHETIIVFMKNCTCVYENKFFLKYSLCNLIGVIVGMSLISL